MFAPFKRRSLAAGLGIAMSGTCSLYLKYKRFKFLHENAKDALVMAKQVQWMVLSLPSAMLSLIHAHSKPLTRAPSTGLRLRRWTELLTDLVDAGQYFKL